MSAGHLQTSRRKGTKLFASEFQEMLARELTWYLAEAESASGVSSNFESHQREGALPGTQRGSSQVPPT